MGKIFSEMFCVYPFTLEMKFSGATGNMNAHKVAYPHIDWKMFTAEFVESLGELEEFKDVPCEFSLNEWTTQIDSYDSHARWFNTIKQYNMICIDFCRDVWTYISNGLIIQTPKKEEVGSSTMPHKINPIDFENAEGNLLFANAMLEFYASKLPVSRLQRDLSDSTVVRNIGMTFAYCLIGYSSLVKGLGKIKPNTEAIARELEAHPEVVTEAYQTILRREGMLDAYDALKSISRLEGGVTMETLHVFVDTLLVKDEVKAEMKAITPANYTGYAGEIVTEAKIPDMLKLLRIEVEDKVEV
jgi:adenylosuccinate lyase